MDSRLDELNQNIGGTIMINLNEYLSIGQNTIIQKIVQPEDTAEKYVSPFKEILSSPRLIRWAIDASVDTLDPYLPEKYASIGTEVSFVHTAPTSVGMTVTVHVAIDKITGNDIILSVQAWDEQGKIGYGTLRRTIVDIKNVINRAKERSKIITSRKILNWAKS